MKAYKICDEVQITSLPKGASEAGIKIAAFSSGEYLAVWSVITNSPNYIFGQLLSKTGAILGPGFLITADTTTFKVTPAIAILKNDDFVVVWSQRVQQYYTDIIGQHFSKNATRIGLSFRISSPKNGFQDSPAITAISNEALAVVWAGPSATDNSGPSVIYYQRLSNTWKRLGVNIAVNEFTAGINNHPSIAKLSNDEHAIVWSGTSQDQQGTIGILGQSYSNQSTKIRSNFKIYSGPVVNSLVSTSVAIQINGGYLATWGGNGISGQRCDNNGRKLGPLISISDKGNVFAPTPTVATLLNEKYTVVWPTYWHGTYGQELSRAGTKLGSNFLINSTKEIDGSAAIASSLIAEEFMVIWTTISGLISQRYSYSSGAVQSCLEKKDDFTIMNFNNMDFNIMDFNKQMLFFMLPIIGAIITAFSAIAYFYKRHQRFLNNLPNPDSAANHPSDSLSLLQNTQEIELSPLNEIVTTASDGRDSAEGLGNLWGKRSSLDSKSQNDSAAQLGPDSSSSAYRPR